MIDTKFWFLRLPFGILMLFISFASNGSDFQVDEPYSYFVGRVFNALEYGTQIKNQKILPFPYKVEASSNQQVSQIITWRVVKNASDEIVVQLNEDRSVFYIEFMGGINKKVFPVFLLRITKNKSGNSRVFIEGAEYMEDKEACCGPHGPYMAYIERPISEQFVQRFYKYLVELSGA